MTRDEALAELRQIQQATLDDEWAGDQITDATVANTKEWLNGTWDILSPTVVEPHGTDDAFELRYSSRNRNAAIAIIYGDRVCVVRWQYAGYTRDESNCDIDMAASTVRRIRNHLGLPPAPSESTSY